MYSNVQNITRTDKIFYLSHVISKLLHRVGAKSSIATPAPMDRFVSIATCTCVKEYKNTKIAERKPKAQYFD